MEPARKMRKVSDDDVDIVDLPAVEAQNYHETATAFTAPSPLGNSSNLSGSVVEMPHHEYHGRLAETSSLVHTPSISIASSVSHRKREREAEPACEEDTKKHLEMEAREHLQTKLQLQHTAKALEAEESAHRETRHQLTKIRHKADDMRKSWVDAANHLDRVLRQGQLPNQMTDDELIQKSTGLRFKVKNFALQFFGDEVMFLKSDHAASRRIANIMKISHRRVKAYVHSPSLRPMLIRVFLWHLLREDIFGQFFWASSDASSAMFDLSSILNCAFDTGNGQSIRPNDMSKFHMWRANTSNLVHDATQRMEAAPGDIRRQYSELLARNVYEMLAPYSAAQPQVIRDRLFDLINLSLELDERFSRQVASLRWTSSDASQSTDTRAFDPRLMEIERGETRTSPEQKISMVLSPSLVKWGKTSGEDFDVSVILLKMEVTLQSPPKTQQEPRLRQQGDGDVVFSP